MKNAKRVSTVFHNRTVLTSGYIKQLNKQSVCDTFILEVFCWVLGPRFDKALSNEEQLGFPKSEQIFQFVNHGQFQGYIQFREILLYISEKGHENKQRYFSIIF